MSRFNPSDKKNILYLFDRPGEPLIVGKGDDFKVGFSVPADYLPDRYKNLSDDLNNRFGSDSQNNIPVRPLSNIPDLNLSMSMDRRGSFSVFIPQHREARFLTKQTSFEDFKSLSVYCRDRMNPYMYIYALSVAILHRNDCKEIPLPSFAEILPEKFMDKSVFVRLREEANVVQDPGSRIPFEIPKDYSASDLDEEHRVAYFREDIGINLHHWHWHLVYPFEGATNIVNKDRRGELFYYMHQQVLARYNAERLSNKLLRTRKFNNFREAIPEAYFSKLDAANASRTWPPRFKNSTLSDINRDRDRLRFELADLERWRDRVLEAIHTKSVTTPRGDRVPLTEEKGIDILGNMLEASNLSINKDLYGELHNFGHLAIAYCHDPDNRYLESFGVMGDSTTAMRDPIFYRWHENINDIFMVYKNSLPPYSTDQLNYDQIRIKNVEVSAPGIPKNEFSTFWQQSDVNLSRGLDFAPRGRIYARFTHLQHAPFTIKINVENTSGKRRRGTVRIFLAPKFDERNSQFNFREQKGLFMELDRFVVDLNDRNTVIERSSLDSSVTIPFDTTFRELDTNRPAEGSDDLAAFNFCGCGWPQHMLIPKGSADGFACQLFVMVSDYEQDRVDSPQSTATCDNASSFCGVRDSKYPDKRAMGFPFDRVPRSGVNTMQQFLTPNMAVLDVKIRFADRIVRKVDKLLMKSTVVSKKL
ncbi:hypothetical protein M8J75_012530 [Diaphorina citri]|nr:hypothetical protein M8J75_012530 [Diaphorina citri]